jgi:integrase
MDRGMLSVQGGTVSTMARGSVEELRSGFRARVYAGKDQITGKQTYLRGQTRRERGQAEQDCTRLLTQVEAETHPDRSATVETLMQRWIEVVDHELTTRDTTAGYIRRVINPALGDMSLRKLQHRVDVLDRLYTHLRRCGALCDGRPFVEHKSGHAHKCAELKCRPHVCKPMSPGSVRRIHGILSPALSYAVSWGWIERNPAEYAHPPKLKRRRARPPEAEQVARLLNLAWETSIEFAMFLWLATTTGARRGELAGLRWSRIDLNASLIKIENNYVVRGGQREEKDTKTDTDRRLSLDPLTVQMLTDFREQRVAQLAPAHLTLEPTAFVFSPDPAGLRPWHPDHFSHAYRELADVLRIAEPLKNLRHFNATQLLAAGVDLRTTAGRLGHGDGGATTLKVYADWMPATDRKAVEQLSADLAAQRAVQAAKCDVESTAAASTLPRLARPIAEILEPPIDGRTTYVVVAAALRAAIVAGRLEPGDLVPTVTELGSWFGIVRSTAQRAVALLAAQDQLVRRGPRWIVATR